MQLGLIFSGPPFPPPAQWPELLASARAAGIDHVALTVPWGWVEIAPGDWRFEDHDRLMDLAEKAGLGVTLRLSDSAQPLWLHRLEVDAHQRDAGDRPRLSQVHADAPAGLTPGGCPDHPGVAKRLAGFVTTVAKRYREAKALRAWHITPVVPEACWCAHTLSAWRLWLQQRYSSTDPLNRAWQRRYGCWDDVAPPRDQHSAWPERRAWAAYTRAQAQTRAQTLQQTLRAVDAKHPCWDVGVAIDAESDLRLVTQASTASTSTQAWLEFPAQGADAARRLWLAFAASGAALHVSDVADAVAVRDARARQRETLSTYRPAAARSGVWGDHAGADAYRDAMWRSGRACRQMHEDTVDLDGLELLIVPGDSVIAAELEDTLDHFVRVGGTLLLEAGAGAHDDAGQLLPPNERFAARRFGLLELPSQPTPDGTAIAVHQDQLHVQLRAGPQLCAWQGGTTVATHALADGDHQPVIVAASRGDGRVIACGTSLGATDATAPQADFDRFVAALATLAGDDAALTPITEGALTVAGSADSRRVLTVAPLDASRASALRLDDAGTAQFSELIAHRIVPVQRDDSGARVTLPPAQIAVLLAAPATTTRTRRARTVAIKRKTQRLTKPAS